MRWSRELLGRSGLYLQKKMDRLYYHACGREERPVFYDTAETHPALRVIDDNYEAIREELVSILPRMDGVPRYHHVFHDQTAISGGSPGNWRTLFLSIFGAGDSLPNRNLCPRTVAVLERIPNLLQAFFSILEPGKSIPAHNGPHFFSLRYHTAFLVPTDRPPVMRVKDRHYTWREGQSLLFDDSWEHEVTNESEGVRVVLITDIIRPKPKLLEPLLRSALKITIASWTKKDWEEQYERVVIR